MTEKFSPEFNKVVNSKKPLPHGWIVLPSKTYPNRVYYFNQITKCSTWENPCEDEQKRVSSEPSLLRGQEKNKTIKYKSNTSIEQSNKDPKTGFLTSGFLHLPHLSNNTGTDTNEDTSVVWGRHFSEEYEEAKTAESDEVIPMVVDEPNIIEDYDEDQDKNFSSNLSSTKFPQVDMASPDYSPPEVLSSLSNNKSAPLFPPQAEKESSPKPLWYHLSSGTTQKRSITLSDLDNDDLHIFKKKRIAHQSSFNPEKKGTASKRPSVKERLGKKITLDAEENSAKEQIVDKVQPYCRPRWQRGKQNSFGKSVPDSSSKTNNSGSSNNTRSGFSNRIQFSGGTTPAQSRLKRVRQKVFEDLKSGAVTNHGLENISPGGRIGEQNDLNVKLQASRQRRKIQNSGPSECEKNVKPLENKTKKSLTFKGVVRTEYSPSQPIKVTQYVDELQSSAIEADDEVEEMEWEPIEEEEVVEHINACCKDIDKESSLSESILFDPKLTQEKKQQIKTASWFLVLDTNIYISGLKFIQDMRDTDVPDLGYPVLYIPWRVLQELDNLKDNKSTNADKKISLCARKAIEYVNSNFRTSHPRVRGQTLDEYGDMADLGLEVPDDDILKSCIQLMKADKTKTVIFITNDKNLHTKCHVNNINVFTKDEFESQLSEKKMKTLVPQNVDYTHNEVYLCDLQEILKNVLTVVLRTELHIAYGKDWRKYLYRKEPWSLQDTLDCFVKYWISVFGMIFSKQVQRLILNLQEKFCRRKNTGHTWDINQAIDVCQLLFREMRATREPRISYSELLNSSLSEVTRLSNLVHSFSKKSSNNEVKKCVNEKDKDRKKEEVNNNADGSNPLNNRKETYVQRFEKVKHIFKNIWSFVQNYCCSEASEYKNEDPQSVKKLTKIGKNLNELLCSIEKINQSGSNHFTTENDDIIHLTKVLNNWQIICGLPSAEEQLLPSIALFCSSSCGRELLQKSCKDFTDFLVFIGSLA